MKQYVGVNPGTCKIKFVVFPCNVNAVKLFNCTRTLVNYEHNLNIYNSGPITGDLCLYIFCTKNQQKIFFFRKISFCKSYSLDIFTEGKGKVPAGCLLLKPVIQVTKYSMSMELIFWCSAAELHNHACIYISIV